MNFKLPKGHAYRNSNQGEPGASSQVSDDVLQPTLRKSTPVTVDKTSHRLSLLNRLDFSADGLVNGILYSEILGKPLCKRGPRRL